MNEPQSQQVVELLTRIAEALERIADEYDGGVKALSGGTVPPSAPPPPSN